MPVTQRLSDSVEPSASAWRDEHARQQSDLELAHREWSNDFERRRSEAWLWFTNARSALNLVVRAFVVAAIAISLVMWSVAVISLGTAALVAVPSFAARLTLYLTGGPRTAVAAAAVGMNSHKNDVPTAEAQLRLNDDG